MKKKIILLLVCISILLSFNYVYAQLDGSVSEEVRRHSVQTGLNAGFAPASDDALSNITQKVINAFLSLLGIIFVILIIQAGYSWMTAGGDEQKVTKAKDTIQRAIIGLIIIIGAYAITYFVFTNVPFGNGSGANTNVNVNMD